MQTVLAELRPTDKARVIDLVQAAGVDVADWSNFKGGAAKAAVNPKYCYEWAFVQPGKVVVLNLWFASMRAENGMVSQRLQLRGSRNRGKGVWTARAARLDAAIQVAAREGLPVRVIVCDGRLRKAGGKTTKASTVSRRRLDRVPWAVTRYDWRTSECRIERATTPTAVAFAAIGEMTTSWTREEVKAVVVDYFHMLTLGFAGRSYNKAAYLRALAPKLRDRNKSSIEFKRQNISAVLRDLGFPWIPGYKPMGNYQQLLFDVVETRISEDPVLDRAALAAVAEPAVVGAVPDDRALLVDAPRIEGTVDGPPPAYRAHTPIRRDYLAMESRNRSLGAAGEALVVEYERRRLHRAGKPALSERIDHVSVTRGDGLGYDVLSYEPDGRERFIEVKTTAFDKHTPFYLSRNELSFSEEAGRQYRLYRLFEFRKQPHMFELVGSVKSHCLLDPVSYLARFG